MECASKIDGRLERGNAKRQAILERAVDLASLNGLDGLSLGRLATELGISKSGALLHFGSKLELQLAIIATAANRVYTNIVVPAAEHPAGLPRLWFLAHSWLAHIRDGIFPGGCFFSTVGAEFASRPGQVRDALAEVHRKWSEVLEEQARAARETRQLRDGVEPGRLAFEIDALIRHANLHHQLHDDHRVFALTTGAVRELLDRVATPGTPERIS